MAVLWQYSLTPRHDASGNPYSGAKAYFFDAGTTTPQSVYTNADLSDPHDHPVVADSNGVFPAVFFPDETSHRLRILTDDGVTLHDVDNISVPTTTPPDIPDSDTPVEQRFQTGDIKMAWRVDAPNGWVRLNGRTIGSVASGAAERANADCEDLFEFLWNKDSTLVVSGGRGANAASDWAADKTIALPDPRGRALVVLDAFGNSAAGRVTDAVLGADSDTLGAAGGSETHTLTKAQMPEHEHTGTTESNGDHKHSLPMRNSDGSAGADANRLQIGTNAAGVREDFTNMEETGAHTHTFETDTEGGGEAHSNLQPSIMIPLFIKL